MFTNISERIHKKLVKVAVGRDEAKKVSKEKIMKHFVCHDLEFGLCVQITLGCHSKTYIRREIGADFYVKNRLEGKTGRRN